jgi:aldehyde dehydrogenase (NAD+)
VKKHQMLIGGKWVDPASGEWFESVNPFTAKPWALVPRGSKADVDQAIAAAHCAFHGEWRKLSATARGALIHKFGELVAAEAERLAEIESTDNGKLIAEMRGQLNYIPQWYYYYGGLADKIEGRVIPIDKPGVFNFTREEPLGVVAAITAWNSPLLLATWKLAPALAAGNCVVVKPAELTPFAPDLYARLVREAGIPDGVFSLLPGGIEAGEALVNHPKVEKISFTGGPIAARKIMVACAEQLKPCVLELGGKSASLLFPDADIDPACARAVQWSIGVMAGQGCALPTRLLAHESIYDAVIEKCVEIAKTYKVGDPFEEGVRVGPLINAAACDRVMGMLERVRSEKSGRIVMGGGRCGGALAGKNYIEPTIIADADPDSEIAQIEIFGPVLLIMKFKDEDEAVRIANATKYGLAAYIQTENVRRVHRLSERLKAGGVYVNGAAQIHPYTPFGGLGVSGFGKEGGRAGLDEFLRYKTITIA